MSISPTIKSVNLGALTAASAAMTAAKPSTTNSTPKLDADGNSIHDDEGSTELGKKKTENFNKVQDPKSEIAKKATADKAVKDATTVPATKQAPINVADILKVDADAKTKAIEDAKSTQNTQTKDSSWQGAGAQTTDPSLDSSHSIPKGEDLQNTLATDDPSKLLGGFKSPETPSSSPDSQGQSQAAQGGGSAGGFGLGGGLGGANAGQGGININSGNVNINSNNGSGNLDSFNNGPSGNVENFNGGGDGSVTPSQPEPESAMRHESLPDVGAGEE